MCNPLSLQLTLVLAAIHCIASTRPVSHLPSHRQAGRLEHKPQLPSQHSPTDNGKKKEGRGVTLHGKFNENDYFVEPFPKMILLFLPPWLCLAGSWYLIVYMYFQNSSDKKLWTCFKFKTYSFKIGILVDVSIKIIKPTPKVNGLKNKYIYIFTFIYLSIVLQMV